MNALPDNLVPVLDVVSAIRWLAPPTDYEDEDGYENDDAPIAAMYEMSESIPGFRIECLDVLNKQGPRGLNRFILDWCGDKFGDVVDETRQLLFGVPAPTFGFEIQDDNEYEENEPILNFICNLIGKTLPDDAAEPATWLQPPLPNINEELGPIKLIDDFDDTYDGPYDDIPAWTQYHDYNTLGDDETDSDEEYRRRTNQANAQEEEARREKLFYARYDMSITAGLICQSLTKLDLNSNMDPEWKKVGWAVGWLFSVTTNSLADMTWEEGGEMTTPSWNEWKHIQEIITEAQKIYEQAQEGLTLIRRSHLIRTWLAFNIKKCNSLREKWSINAHKHLNEITWPALTAKPAASTAPDAAPV